MLKMNEDLEGALKVYIKLLEEKAYFEAHEVLEEAWHPLRLKKDPLANTVKGFINGAIALEHLKRDRKNAQDKAQKVMASYVRYRDNCTPTMPHSILFYKAKTYLDSSMREHRTIFDV